jgi:hypothetical protein
MSSAATIMHRPTLTHLCRSDIMVSWLLHSKIFLFTVVSDLCLFPSQVPYLFSLPQNVEMIAAVHIGLVDSAKLLGIIFIIIIAVICIYCCLHRCYSQCYNISCSHYVVILSVVNYSAVLFLPVLFFACLKVLHK